MNSAFFLVRINYFLFKKKIEMNLYHIMICIIDKIRCLTEADKKELLNYPAVKK
jgi:hypothetical protein